MTLYASSLDYVTVEALELVHPGDVAILHAEVGTDGHPQLIAGTVQSVSLWGEQWPGHLMKFTAPVAPELGDTFPVTPMTIYSFITAYRALIPRIEKSK